MSKLLIRLYFCVICFMSTSLDSVARIVHWRYSFRAQKGLRVVILESRNLKVNRKEIQDVISVAVQHFQKIDSRKFNETLLTQVNQRRQTRRVDRTRKSNPLVLLIWLHVKKVFRLQQRTYIMSWNHDSISHHSSNWQSQHTSFILKVFYSFMY